MEKKKETKIIPLSVVGITEEDITEFQTPKGTARLLDIQKLKNVRGAEICTINDLKLGINIEVQSFRHPAEVVGGLCFNLFNKIQSKRNFNSSRNYLG